MDNSAGIEHFPERQMDMCRLGIGLYGVDPRDNRILHTVSTLKTTILQLRHVPKGETVGYSRKGKIERNSVIAAIPIGYADGLNRHLGNRHGYCLVNGQKAEYVGNICMDVAMIDVTDIPCKEGDQVEIFGEHLPVTQLSDERLASCTSDASSADHRCPACLCRRETATQAAAIGRRGLSRLQLTCYRRVLRRREQVEGCH